MNAVVTACHLVQSNHVTMDAKTGTRMMSGSSMGAYCAWREVRRQLLKRAGGMATASYVDSRDDTAFKRSAVHRTGGYCP